MLNTLLLMSMWIAFIGLILWGLWLVCRIIMALFPYAAAVTFGILVVVAFTAWRRSNGS